MIVKCKYCNKEFNIRPSMYKKSKTKIFYCCREHMNIDKNIGKTIVKCSTCGKEILKKNSQIYEHNFCNRECQKNFKPMKKLICECCNKEFKVADSYYKKQNKRGQTPKFCSKECMIKKKGENKIKSSCSNCKKEIYITKGKHKLNFCSQNCRIKYVKENGSVITKCDYCGKTIIKNKYNYEHTNKHFCNQKCFDEYRKVTKEKYLEIAHFLRSSKEYDIWRKNILERDHYKCQICGKKQELHVHHIQNLYNICSNYNMDIDNILNSKEFNDIDNGITLCKDCHALEHPYISRDEKGRFICRSKSKSTEDLE